MNKKIFWFVIAGVSLVALGVLLGKYVTLPKYDAAGEDYYFSNLYASNVGSTSPSYYNPLIGPNPYSNKFRCDSYTGYVNSTYSFNETTNLLFKDRSNNIFLRSTLTKPGFTPNLDLRLKNTGPLSTISTTSSGKLYWQNAFTYPGEYVSEPATPFDYSFKTETRADGIYAVSNWVKKKYTPLKTVYTSNKIDSRIQSYNEGNSGTAIEQLIFGSGSLAYKICVKK